MTDLDEAARATYARMRARGGTFGSTSDDPQVRERLIELGLLNPDTDVSVDASVALVGTLARSREDLDALTQRHMIAATLTRHFLGVADPQGGGADVEFFPRSELPRLQQAIDELTELAAYETVSMHPVASWPKESDRARRRVSAILARGVRMRSLYQQSSLNDPAFRDRIKLLAGEGEEIRFAPFIPTRMIAVDQQIAILQADPADIDSGAVMIRGPAVVASLAALFEYSWLSASDADDVPHSNAGLTDQQRTVLRMLATGAKDEAIARSMGVSTRTVARLVGELLTRLGAQSRFQAGLRAGKLGWLD